MLKKLNSEPLEVAIDENPTFTTRQLSKIFHEKQLFLINRKGVILHHENARPLTSKQPQVSLKNLAGKSSITHHILPIFSGTNRFSSFQELTESLNGTKAYFKRRGVNEARTLITDWLGGLYAYVLACSTCDR
ncbi:hypothetical protein ACTXT7_009359 [Hymenolepis weldensis]